MPRSNIQGKCEKVEPGVRVSNYEQVARAVTPPRPRAARKPLCSKRLLRAAGGAEAALLGKHALKPIVGRAIRRALHDGTQTVLCMRMFR